MLRCQSPCRMAKSFAVGPPCHELKWVDFPVDLVMLAIGGTNIS